VGRGEAFATEPLIALVNLIGRYMNTAAMLACFGVPAPARLTTTHPQALRGQVLNRSRSSAASAGVSP
jgi:hypothetical protein